MNQKDVFIFSTETLLRSGDIIIDCKEITQIFNKIYGVENWYLIGSIKRPYTKDHYFFVILPIVDNVETVAFHIKELLNLEIAKVKTISNSNCKHCGRTVSCADAFNFVNMMVKMINGSSIDS